MSPSTAMSLDNQDEMVKIFKDSIEKLTQDIDSLVRIICTIHFSREDALDVFQSIYNRLKADWIIDDAFLELQGISPDSELDLLAQKALPLSSSSALYNKLTDAFSIVEKMYDMFASTDAPHFYGDIATNLVTLSHFLSSLPWESSGIQDA